MSATLSVHYEGPSCDGHSQPQIGGEDSNLIHLNTQSLASLPKKDVSELSWEQSWARRGLEDCITDLTNIGSDYGTPEPGTKAARELSEMREMYRKEGRMYRNVIKTSLFPPAVGMGTSKGCLQDKSYAVQTSRAANKSLVTRMTGGENPGDRSELIRWDEEVEEIMHAANTVEGLDQEDQETLREILGNCLRLGEESRTQIENGLIAL